MKTFDTASFSLNAEQQAMLDELYPIINEEFKADNGIISAYHKAQTQPNTKLSFVSYINPLVIQMAHALGSTLNIPLAAIISRTIANEWLEETKAFDPAKPLNEIMDRADAEVLAVPAEVSKERIVGASPAFAEPYGKPTDFAGILRLTTVFRNEEVTEIIKALEMADRMPKTPEQEEEARRMLVAWNNASQSLLGMSVAQIQALISYGSAKVAVQDEPIIPTSVPRKSLARGSAGQDRSKPVLTVAVMRGLHELLGAELSTTSPSLSLPPFRGRPDARLAVKYLQRLAAWGDKREASKEK